MQNVENLDKAQITKDLEGAGLKKLPNNHPDMSIFERGKMKIRLDPPQKGTPFHHMHLNFPGQKDAYDIYMHPIDYRKPGAHLKIKQ